MWENLFNGIFDTDLTRLISAGDFLKCIATALVLGLTLTLCYMFRNRYTKSFAVTLALLPAVVCVVIMMVNGNIGAGVAVAGAFSLVRFRSVPGTAREICTLFLAMSIGLVVGMGYLGFAALFALVMCLVFVIYNLFSMGAEKNTTRYKTLSVTIPEDLDYTGVFEDIFAQYTQNAVLTRVKTTNMGSMFRLTYQITLKEGVNEKEMIDKIRCRNGNLEVSLSCQEMATVEL